MKFSQQEQALIDAAVKNGGQLPLPEDSKVAAEIDAMEDPHKRTIAILMAHQLDLNNRIRLLGEIRKRSQGQGPIPDRGPRPRCTCAACAG